VSRCAVYLSGQRRIPPRPARQAASRRTAAACRSESRGGIRTPRPGKLLLGAPGAHGGQQIPISPSHVRGQCRSEPLAPPIGICHLWHIAPTSDPFLGGNRFLPAAFERPIGDEQRQRRSRTERCRRVTDWHRSSGREVGMKAEPTKQRLDRNSLSQLPLDFGRPVRTGG
jgi:hypothetical protein